jgi:hypothetical protein
MDVSYSVIIGGNRNQDVVVVGRRRQMQGVL